MAKIRGPQPISQRAGIPNHAVPNVTDGKELYPSSGEISESEDDILQNPGFYPLEVGDNVWRMNTPLDSLEPRFGVQLAGHGHQVRFHQHSGVGLALNESDCVDLFMHQSLILHILDFTKDSILNAIKKMT